MSAAQADAEPVRLAGELNIYRAAELRRELVAAVASAPAVVLDLAEVSELDSSGVQLLFLARACARAQGKTFQLQALSAPVGEVFALLGLHQEFETVAA